MAIDQLLAAETLDAIVGFLSGDFCTSMGDDRCPEFVDVVIRQGLPMLAAAGADGDFSQVPHLVISKFRYFSPFTVELKFCLRLA